MFARDPRTMPILFLFIGLLIFGFGVQKQLKVNTWTDEYVAREIADNQAIDDLYYAGTGNTFANVEDPSNTEARHQAIELAITTEVKAARRGAKTSLLGGGFLILFMGFAVYRLWRNGDLKRDPSQR